MLVFVRITQKRLALYVCRRLRQYNHVQCTVHDVLRSPHYVIYKERTLVGWIGFKRCGGRRFEIRHLTVLPQARHQGIGHAAITSAIALLCERGAKSCHAYVRYYNTPSIGLFKKQGFRLTRGGRLRKYVRDLCCQSDAHNTPTHPCSAEKSADVMPVDKESLA